MEDNIGSFCKTLAYFCNHLHSSCHALKQSVDRRPIPLDSASSTFAQCLNRRISSASTDLNLLETMSFGTVSFEELLGHFNEVYKKNQSDLSELEDRLRDYGYVPNMEIDDDDDEASGLPPTLGFGSRILDAATDSIAKKFDEDPLSDESLSLKNLGLSEVCLATLASDAYEEMDNSEISLKEPIKRYEDKLHNVEGLSQSAKMILDTIAGELEDHFNSVGAPKSVINATKNDYEQLPSFMKSLVSWEDLLAAVEKINSGLRNKNNGNFFHQHEVESLELGPKARSYLLLLVRMNLLVVETIDGSISYRVL